MIVLVSLRVLYYHITKNTEEKLAGITRAKPLYAHQTYSADTFHISWWIPRS